MTIMTSNNNKLVKNYITHNKIITIFYLPLPRARPTEVGVPPDEKDRSFSLSESFLSSSLMLANLFYSAIIFSFEQIYLFVGCRLSGIGSVQRVSKELVLYVSVSPEKWHSLSETLRSPVETSDSTYCNVCKYD